MSEEDNKRRAEQTIAGLNATLGRRLVQPARQLVEATPVVSTTFPPLDIALGLGGIPRGYLTEIVGNPTSGIVTLALKTLTTIQQGGGQVVYLDLAATFNPDYAVRCGLNLETVWVVRPTPYALTWTILYDLVLDGGVGLLLWLLLMVACQTRPRNLLPLDSPTTAPSPTPVTPTLSPTPPFRRLQPGELVLAADTDDIPAIMAQDSFFAAATTDEWLDEEYVIGLSLNGDARAYPIRLLSSHELVNDTVGGQPVLISWCPLCFSAIVFDRTVDERELTFGVSGILYRDNLVMYDHQTHTLWSQLLGQSLRGALRQQWLTVVPSMITTWAEWKQLYPETRVLSAERLGQYEGDVIDPYAGYYTSGAAGLAGDVTHAADVPAKALVIGVQVGTDLRAYPLPLLSEVGLIEDELGGVPLLLVYDATLQVVYVYQREANGPELTFAAATTPHTLQDKQTASIWDWRIGQATAGVLTGTMLTPFPATLTFWFAWAGIFPETDVYVP